MNNKNILEEEVFEEIEVESFQVSKDDLNKIVSKEKEVIIKSSKKLDLIKFGKLINQIKLTVNLIKDYKNKSYIDIPWRSIALIGASILYFLNPFDIVPDVFPVLGFTDDAIFFATVFKSIQIDLEKYCEWKGLNPEKYF